MLIPNYPKFKTIDYNDLEYISNMLNKAHYPICELSLTNLFIWKDFDRGELTKINNNTCILINPLNESPYFLEPLSNSKLTETIGICLGHTNKLSRLSENFIFKTPQENYMVSCLRSQFDYIFKVKDLAELKGKKHDGKRNHIKKYLKQFSDAVFLPIGSENIIKAMDLFENWFKIRKESRFFPKLAYNSQKSALNNSFKYFTQLNLVGGGLFCKDKLHGFIIGSRLNSDTITIHFAYADPNIKGATQALLNYACQTIYKNFNFINLEQDLGIPGLRQSKLSWHPHHLERKFELKNK